MKILFVTDVEEKKLKALCPWMKRVIPMMGGFFVLDTDKFTEIQGEFIKMAKRELVEMKKADKVRARMEKQHAAYVKKHPMVPLSTLMPMSGRRRA